VAKKTSNTSADHDRSKLQLPDLHFCRGAQPVLGSFRGLVLAAWRHYEKKLPTGPHM
jgi:hypothetical protein